MTKKATLSKKQVLEVVNQARLFTQGFNWVSVDEDGEMWAWTHKPEIYRTQYTHVKHNHEWWWGSREISGNALVHRFDAPVKNWKKLCFQLLET